MTDADRHRLLFGPSRTPPFRYGNRVFCEGLGDVVIVGLSSGPIPWPKGRRRDRKRGGGSLILYGDLAEAVRRASALAVAHWWGVTAQTVWVWRKALGVGATTAGTSRLRHDNFEEPWAEAARAKAHAKAGDPQRRAKIATAKLGKPRPPHVGKAVAQAHRGTHHSEESRRKMSRTHKRRGTRPPKAGRPWTAEEDELLRTLPAKEGAAKTGPTLTAVSGRRIVLDLPDGRTQAERTKQS